MGNMSTEAKNPPKSKNSTHSMHGLPPRAKSTHSRPSKPQTRTQKNDKKHSSRYDSTLIDGFRNLRIRSSSPSPNRNNIRRGRKTIDDIAQLIKSGQVRNIVVMTGAGISTESGIPDFRTPGTGLYDNLKQYKIPYPQAIFDTDYFQLNPRPFFTLAKELYPSGKYQPNYAHYFLRMLHEKKLLLRVYTQNIDGLERLAGIPPEKIIEAHGTFLSTSCTKCKQPQPTAQVKDAIFMNKIPRCTRSGCMSLVKPDIVFFGEDLPRKFYYYLRDFPMADMLLVMGTSLEVEPFASIVDSCRIYIPRVLFNREAVGPFKSNSRMNDVTVTGDITGLLRGFSSLLGWKSDMDSLLKEVGFSAMGSVRPPTTNQPTSSGYSAENNQSDKQRDQSTVLSASKILSQNKESDKSLLKDKNKVQPICNDLPVASLNRQRQPFTGIPGQGRYISRQTRSALASYGTDMHSSTNTGPKENNTRMGKLPHLYKHGPRNPNLARAILLKTNMGSSSEDEEDSDQSSDESCTSSDTVS